MAKITDYSHHEARDLIRALLAKQCAILNLTIERSALHAEELRDSEQEMLRVIWTMMRGIAGSVRSLILLTAKFDMSIRDCYGVARSIFESAVNVAYLVAEGPDAARLARQHAMQKAYRQFARAPFSELNLPPEPNLPDAKDIPGMVEALQKFTRPNGSEITDWAGVNVHSKLEVIYTKFPGIRLPMSVATSEIYRDASEILHGSFYAIEMFWEPCQNEDGSQRTFEDVYVYNHLIRLFTTVSASINGMLEVVSQHYEYVETTRLIVDFWEASAELLSENSGGK